MDKPKNGSGKYLKRESLIKAFKITEITPNIKLIFELITILNF